MHALGQYAGEMVFGKMLKLGIESHENIVSSFTCKNIMGKMGARWDSIGIYKLFYWYQKPGNEIKENTLTPDNYFVDKILDDAVTSNVAIRTRQGNTENVDSVHEQLSCGSYDMVSVADAIYEMIMRDPSFDWGMSVTRGLLDVSHNVTSVGNDIKSELTEIKEMMVDIPAQAADIFRNDFQNVHNVPLGPIWFPVDAFQQQTVYGREQIVADLHKDIESIKGKKWFVIHGIGGMGKTTVVWKYVKQYHKNYHHFIRIHAQNVATAHNQFRLLATNKLGIQPETAQTSPENFEGLFENIYEKLCCNQAKVLLVLDNAEAVSFNNPENTNSVESLKSLLPPSLPGNDITVLITSKESSWNDDFFHSIKLGHWTDEECVDFVIKKLKLPSTVENKKTALALATHFDRLTISLQSAVSIIREVKDRQQHEGEVSYGIQDLINDYDRGREGRLPEMHLWNISFENILRRDNGELAIKIICFMAYLSPDAIPKRFLRALFHDTNNERCLTDAFQLLSRFSLIDHFDTHYTIHRRIQEAVIQNLKLQSSSGSEVSLIFVSATFKNETRVLKKLSKQLYAYLSQMTIKETLAEENFDVMANCLHVTSYLSKELYCFLECREFAEAVADIMDNSCNDNKALELYKTVLKSIDPATDKNFEQSLKIKDKMGGVLERQEKFEEALEIFSEMLKVKLDVFGTDHPSTLETQGNYILMLVELKRHNEASEMFDKFQEDIKKMTHLEHSSASIAKWNFASLLYSHMKDYEAALTLFQNVLQELSQSQKPDKKRILDVQGWIADTLSKLGRHDEAAELHSKILSRVIKEFSPTSKLTLSCRKNYACALHQQGKLKEELQVRQDVLNHEENLKDSQNVNLNISVTKLNVAQSYIDLKEFDKAIETLESLVDSYRDEHGPDHPDTLHTMHELAFALWGNSEYNDSLKIYKQVLEGRIKALGVLHSDTLVTKHNISWVYFDKGDFEKAHLIACEILSTREKSIAGDHKFDYSDTETLHRNALHRSGPMGKMKHKFLSGIRASLYKFFRDSDSD